MQRRFGDGGLSPLWIVSVATHFDWQIEEDAT
jgi:hypothetical protein